MKQENIQLLAVSIILIGMILIVLIPLVFLSGFSYSQLSSQFGFFIILFIGMLFIIFIAVLLAIKQKRNIWG